MRVNILCWSSFGHSVDSHGGNVTKKGKWMFFAAVTAIGLALDVFTKQLVIRNLQYGRPVDLIGEYVQFLFVYNKGAVFGFNPQRFIPGIPVHILFAVFTAIAITILLVYYRRVPTEDRVSRWGVTLIMPGALGNLSDRILHPADGVVDFIRVGISERLYWPIFNFADIYVTVGVALLLYSFYLEEKRRGQEEKEGKDGSSSDEPESSASQHPDKST